MSSFIKDPAATLDFTWDWSKWLADGETITAHPITVPAGLTLGAVTQAAGKVTAWLSGGVTGTAYRVTCRVTTSRGREDKRTITVAVRDR